MSVPVTITTRNNHITEGASSQHVILCCVTSCATRYIPQLYIKINYAVTIITFRFCQSNSRNNTLVGNSTDNYGRFSNSYRCQLPELTGYHLHVACCVKCYTLNYTVSLGKTHKRTCSVYNTCVARSNEWFTIKIAVDRERS